MYFINFSKCNAARIACELRCHFRWHCRWLGCGWRWVRCLLLNATIRIEMCFHFRVVQHKCSRLMYAAVQPFSLVNGLGHIPDAQRRTFIRLPLARSLPEFIPFCTFYSQVRVFRLILFRVAWVIPLAWQNVRRVRTMKIEKTRIANRNFWYAMLFPEHYTLSEPKTTHQICFFGIS